MIATVLNLNADLFAPIEKVVDIHKLQMKDFAAWLRKQGRRYGRRFEVADNRTNAVEAWLADLGISGIAFLLGGEIEFMLENRYEVSGWTDLVHYMTDDDGNAIRTVGEWLKIVENENAEEYLLQ